MCDSAGASCSAATGSPHAGQNLAPPSTFDPQFRQNMGKLPSNDARANTGRISFCLHAKGERSLVVAQHCWALRSETASRFCCRFRDAVSARDLSRKAHPVLAFRSGMQFPQEPPSGNCIPEFAWIVGCGFRKGAVWETVSRNPLPRLVVPHRIYWAKQPAPLAPICRLNIVACSRYHAWLNWLAVANG